MSEPTVIALDPIRVLILAIGVLGLGHTITGWFEPLRRFSIPVAVTGGVVCSLVVALLDVFGDVQVTFDLAMRDDLLLTFFATIGLSAKLGQLRQGGRLLARLGAATLVFLALQNAVGISIALLLGEPYAFGLIGGSVSLAGGHGTALTWGQMASDAGFERAIPLGMAFATFGLICGGVVGGPLATRLIRRGQLASPSGEAGAETGATPAVEEDPTLSVTSGQVIRTLLALAIAIGVGEELNRWIGDRGIVLPGFLTAMGVGILLTNLADFRREPLDTEAVTLFNQVSLHLFLAMSLMSMQLTQLAGAFGPVFVILAGQVVLAVVFASVVVFRLCGRDYDAAVIAAGYAGLGLGATPVGVANMNAVSSRFGPAPTAFLVIPLVGAFLLDIINAFVIQTYMGLMQ
ncbi:MAG: sodium/glutamate symporter [Myxococcota bacterium]